MYSFVTRLQCMIMCTQMGLMSLSLTLQSVHMREDENLQFEWELTNIIICSMPGKRLHGHIPRYLNRFA
ncbi:hypothetical protein OROHE_000122 [Orobanche hederae]